MLPLNDYFAQELERLNNPKSANYLIAVSGGLDSMVLLDLAQKAGLAVEVAHVNYGLRGDDSDADETSVREICRKHKIQFHVKKIDFKAEFPNANVQLKARELRYAWFEELRVSQGFTYLLTAHHIDDRVETFFINLLRGAGTKGLSSIPMLNGWILRPLLKATKDEIRAYAEQEHLKWREDQSNATDHYLRNKIRHHVLPALVNIEPKALASVAQSIDHLAEVDAYFAREVDEIAIKYQRDNGFLLPFREVNKLQEKAPLWFYFLQRLGFHAEAIDQITELLNSQVGRRVEGSEFTATTERDGLFFSVKNAEAHQLIEISEGKGELLKPIALSWKLEAFQHSNNNGFKAHEAWFNPEALQFPLVLRPWRDGDRIYPIGLKGSKKVSDVLTDSKVVSASRKAIWVLESAGEIVWIIGIRVDRRFVSKPVHTTAYCFLVNSINKNEKD